MFLSLLYDLGLHIYVSVIVVYNRGGAKTQRIHGRHCAVRFNPFGGSGEKALACLLFVLSFPPESPQVRWKDGFQRLGLDAEIRKGQCPIRNDGVGFQETHLIGRKRRVGQHLQNPPQELGNRERQRYQPAPAIGFPLDTLHEFAEAEDAGTTELVDAATRIAVL